MCARLLWRSPALYDGTAALIYATCDMLRSLNVRSTNDPAHLRGCAQLTTITERMEAIRALRARSVSLLVDHRDDRQRQRIVWIMW